MYSLPDYLPTGINKKNAGRNRHLGLIFMGNESYLFVDKNGYFFAEHLCLLPVYPLPKVCGRMYCTVVQNGLVNAALFLPFKAVYSWLLKSLSVKACRGETGRRLC